jgi:hypothetical protein
VDATHSQRRSDGRLVRRVLVAATTVQRRMSVIIRDVRCFDWDAGPWNKTIGLSAAKSIPVREAVPSER